jgi:hypothetical protein
MMGSDQIGMMPWWQIAGALIAVFALLMLGLRALQRWQPGLRRNGCARLLSVQRLGPRRELQRLLVGGTVHTLYRHDSAMVLLESEPMQDRPAGRIEAHRNDPASPGGRLKALLAAAGGRVINERTANPLP